MQRAIKRLIFFIVLFSPYLILNFRIRTLYHLTFGMSTKNPRSLQKKKKTVYKIFIFQRKEKKSADLKVAVCRLPSVVRLYKRIPQNNHSVCHPERSRTFFERRAREKREAFMTRGISLQISVAFWWDVTSALVSHRNSLRDPIVAIAPRFCSVYHSAKLRLRSGWQTVVLFGLNFFEAGDRWSPAFMCDKCSFFGRRPRRPAT